MTGASRDPGLSANFRYTTSTDMTPVLDVASGQQLTGKSHVAVGNALHQLESAGILQRLNGKKWGRVWECGELLDLVAEFEHGVSTP